MPKINSKSVYFTDYTEQPEESVLLFGRADISYFIPTYDSKEVNKIFDGRSKFDAAILLTLKSHLNAQNRIILNDGDQPDAVSLTDESWIDQFHCSFEEEYPPETSWLMAKKLFEQLQEIL